MCNVIERERAEGFEEGRWFQLIRLTMKKKEKGMAADEIADVLEEEEMTIKRIIMAIDKSGAKDVQTVYESMER